MSVAQCAGWKPLCPSDTSSKARSAHTQEAQANAALYCCIAALSCPSVNLDWGCWLFFWPLGLLSDHLRELKVLLCNQYSKNGRGACLGVKPNVMHMGTVCKETNHMSENPSNTPKASRFKIQLCSLGMNGLPHRMFQVFIGQSQKALILSSICSSSKQIPRAMRALAKLFSLLSFC